MITNTQQTFEGEGRLICRGLPTLRVSYRMRKNFKITSLPGGGQSRPKLTSANGKITPVEPVDLMPYVDAPECLLQDSEHEFRISLTGTDGTFISG